MGRPPKYEKKMTAMNLKLSPKHQFGLRLVARIKGDSMGAEMGRVIDELARALPISRNWSELWDEDPAVATLNIFGLPEYRAAAQPQTWNGIKDESEVHALVMAHPEFFYTDSSMVYPRRKFAVILWPHVDDLAKLWKRERDDDYYVAAKKMLAILGKSLSKDPDFKALEKSMAKK